LTVVRTKKANEKADVATTKDRKKKYSLKENMSRYESTSVSASTQKFEAEKWIFVGDTQYDPYSQEQVDICKNLHLPLKGAILCNDENQKKSEACQKVPAFPCFCNIETSVCVSGLRETLEDFEDLQNESDKVAK
jgi:hypothetical protein